MGGGGEFIQKGFEAISEIRMMVITWTTSPPPIHFSLQTLPPGLAPNKNVEAWFSVPVEAEVATAEAPSNPKPEPDTKKKLKERCLFLELLGL